MTDSVVDKLVKFCRHGGNRYKKTEVLKDLVEEILGEDARVAERDAEIQGLRAELEAQKRWSFSLEPYRAHVDPLLARMAKGIDDGVPPGMVVETTLVGLARELRELRLMLGARDVRVSFTLDQGGSDD